MEEKDLYDKKDTYEEKIAPIVQSLKLACSIESMPMFVTIAVANTEEGTDYRSDMLLAGAGLSLTENRIGKILLHLNGYDMDHAPEWVAKDIRELEEYLAKLARAKNGGKKTGVVLNRDIIPEFNEIVNKPKRSE